MLFKPIRIIGLALAAAFAKHAQAQPSAHSQSLKAIPGVIVELSYWGDPRVAAPDTVGIRTQIELELRKAGVPVATFREGMDPKILVTWGLLTYKLVARSGGNGVAVTGLLGLAQPVVVPRTGVFVNAQTWTARDYAAWVPQATLDDEVKRIVPQQVAEFLNAYLSANPRR